MSTERLPTERQIQARRENARRSHGPTTAEGKEKSSRNALKFGFLARNPVLPGEAESQYLDFRVKLLADLQPAGGIEGLLADNIVAAAWRLRRVPLVESGLFAASYCADQAEIAADGAQELVEPDQLSASDAPKNQRQACQKLLDLEAEARDAANRPENALGRAFLYDVRNAGALGRLYRYESTLSRSLHRDLEELRRLQESRGPQMQFLQNDLTEGLNALQ